MFMGEYNHTVDAKGRLIVPSKFREQLGEDFVVTRGLDGCLSVYANDEWTALEEKLHALPYTNPAARKLTRFLVAGAATCEVDKQEGSFSPQLCGSTQGSRKTRCSWVWEAELRSGAGRPGARRTTSMTLRTSRKNWEDCCKCLNINLYCFMRPSTA